VIALLDRGPEPVEFDRRVPLGANMAFRRQAFELAGGWDQRIGRSAGTLMGEEVREWCLRARAKGLRGFYVPHMTVQHVIMPDRLRRRYFRRWRYWGGVSRAMLYQQHGLDMQSPEGARLDIENPPQEWCGVPRELYRTATRSAATVAASWLRGNARAAFEHELWLCMFAGIVRQRWRDRQRPGEGHRAPSVAVTR
jgi:hypothetical protein